MTTSFQYLKEPPLWAKCAIVSLVLHSTVFYVVIQHPIVLKNPLGSFFSKNKPIPTLINADEQWDPNQFVLEHFFEEIPLNPRNHSFSQKEPSIPPPLTVEKLEKSLDIQAPFPKLLKEVRMEESLKIKSLNLVDSSEKMSLPFIKTPLSHFSLPSLPLIREPYSLDLFLAEDTSHFILVNDSLSNIPFLTSDPLKELEKEELSLSMNSRIILEEIPQISLKKEGLLSIQDFDHSTPLIDKPISFSYQVPQDLLAKGSLANINEYLSDELLSAIEWNDDFQIESSFFPEKDGYVFSLAVTPKKDFAEERMKQNFYFLIDVSSQIEKHKLSVFKKSILKALATLQPGDSFNIILLDKKIIKLSPHNLFLSAQNIRLAEDFLEKSDIKDLFSSLQVYESLSNVLSSIEDTAEVHTAVLLTNGKSSLDSKDLRKLVEENQGKMNVFVAAVGQNNDLMPLDLLSSVLGGKLLYSDTNAAFPRKFSTFIKELQAPLAKNLSVSVYANDPKAHLTVTTFANQVPNLYNKGSFTVMGKIDRLCDLHFVLQGTSSKDQIFLKKIVSFDEALPSTQSTKKEWFLQQKTECYKKFLTESKTGHLKQAREILQTVYGKAFAQ